MISIHAPVKGATLIHIRRHYNRDISIHAPVKGATSGVQVGDRYLHVISIHAPVKGATAGTVRDNIYDLFQSTHP